MELLALQLQTKRGVLLQRSAQIALHLFWVIVAGQLVELSDLGLRFLHHRIDVVQLLHAGGELVVGLCLQIATVRDLLAQTADLLAEGQQLALKHELGLADFADLALLAGGTLRERPLFSELFAVFARGRGTERAARFHGKLLFFLETLVAELKNFGAAHFDGRRSSQKENWLCPQLQLELVLGASKLEEEGFALLDRAPGRRRQGLGGLAFHFSALLI